MGTIEHLSGSQQATLPCSDFILPELIRGCRQVPHRLVGVSTPEHALEAVQMEQTPLPMEDGGKLMVQLLLLMQLLSTDLLDCPRKGVGARAPDGWNSNKMD